MQFQLPISIKPFASSIEYSHQTMLIGSCFTEHIGNYLLKLKFPVMQNPSGILFHPVSVCNSIVSYIQPKTFTEEDLFYYDELWHSWHHHGSFSHYDKAICLKHINEVQQEAHNFLQQAKWLIITLGSSFTYQLNEHIPSSFKTPGVTNVANCHKVPAQYFYKQLSDVDAITAALDNMFHQLLLFNPNIQIIFTISPVRHVRDGVIENNRSKARLIEAVHRMVSQFDRLYYFPAYELVIDVLRDYRFYDIDLVHPNYAATQFVLEHFTKTCMNKKTIDIMEQVQEIVTAKNHKALHAQTEKHKNFLKTYAQKTKELMNAYPFLHLEEEWQYFNNENYS